MAVYNFKGDYDNATAYVENDTVKYNGFFYANVLASTGTPPTGLETDNANWGFVETPEIKVEDLPEKMSNTVAGDKVLLAIDSEDGNKTKIIDQDKFVGPPGPPGVGGVLQLTDLTDPGSGAINTVMVDSYDGVVITTTTTGVDQIIADPTDTASGKTFVAINSTGSTDPILINGDPLQVGELVEFIWDGSQWTDQPLALAQKGIIGTFLHTGMETVAVVGGTTFDINPGVYYIVDNYTNPDLPKITRVNYPGSTGNAITNIATALVTYLSIDVDQNIIQSTDNTWGQADRENARLGTITHQNLTTITAFDSVTHGIGWDLANALGDMTRALGIMILNNNDFAFSNAGTDMTIARSAGTAMGFGINRTNRKDPNNLPVSAENPVANFITSWQDGVGGFTLNSINSEITAGVYDNNTAGGVTEPNGIVANNSWVNHRFYYSPDLNLIALAYGQNTYTSEQNALQAINTESYEQNPLFDNVLFRGWLTVKGNATDLSDTAQAVFTTATKFGATGGAGTTSAVTNQTVYENSTQPQVTTDATRGANQIKRGSALDTDTVFEILNGAGAVTASIDGNGKITGDASGLTNLPGGKFNFTFPHDYTNFTPFVANISDVTSYTPPAGKVAYITVADLHLASTGMDINGITVGEFGMGVGQGRVGLVRPLILNDADSIDCNQASQFGSIAGFLVDENIDIEPVTTSGSYTVPAGKYYVITNMYGISSGTAENMMTIGGTTYSGSRTYNQNTTDIADSTENMPILGPGDTFNNVNMGHNGYLIPTSFIG